ncbi:MAG: exosortase/archaeosortase family protein [Candidatus Eisenbacteria bacterium]|uniref:Exosortase/archaeosortase family protein n=1 Tax=Eiseniibacteriota bacterium TaxID=2212470 RepID=A0A937XB89_UNCEI|nr:exosortase/archaeosortase family protein [Candidatus Eisenbacteria bacterium]
MTRLSRLAPPLALLAILAIGYGPVVVEMVRDWARDANYHHGFLIPLVSGYLIWRGRGRLRRAESAPSILGLAGALAAAALFVLGSAGAEVFTQRISLLLLLGSLVLFLHGRHHLRLVAFPLAFLLFAVPLPYLIYYGLTGPLQAFAAKCAIWGLRLVGVQALAEGNMIHLANTSLEVAEACSGIRSLYAFLAVGALVAHYTPLPLWGRLAIFLSTIPLSVAGNAVRVWGSGMGACMVGPEATTGTLHELFGLLVFVVSLVLFLIIKKVAGKLWSSDTSSPSSSSEPPPSMGPGSAGTGRSPGRSPTSTDSPAS